MRKPTVQIAPWVFPLTEETASVPRMCGEKLSAVFTSCINLGSPPRVRGKADKRSALFGGEGITPACAGKSRSGHSHGRTTWDHPRVCGEKVMESTANGYNEGSPPRVRGKGRCARQVDRRPGITPACAGKSLNPRTTMPLRRDHPRVCGEKASACVAGLRRGGSPPRVRGKAGRPVLSQNAPGITPACAGKRRVCHRFLHPARDHPRVCGEKGGGGQNK